MAGNNMCMLIGRSGAPPEVRYLDNGRVVTKVRIAVNRPMGKDKDGNKITDWFGVDFWGKKAELAGELIKKGSLVSVTGAVHIEEWTDNTGAKRTSVKISADDFQMLESKAAAEAMAAAAGEDRDPDQERAPAPVGAAKAAKPKEAPAANDYEEDLDEIPF